MPISVLVSCRADTLFPDAGRATVTLLERLGRQVDFPQGQGCRGQMEINTGYQRAALLLVRCYAEASQGAGVVVVPTGSCTGSARHQHAIVARRLRDEGLARRAQAVAARTSQLPELPTDVLGMDDVGAYYPPRVTYQRRAIVTGAGSGIGKHMVQRLLAEGARVSADELALEGVPEGAFPVHCDVSVKAEMKAHVATAADQIGGVDMLFSNAGIGSTPSMLDASVDGWDQALAVSVRGVFLGAKHALRQTLAQGHGVIINTASVTGLIGLPDWASYCVSRARSSLSPSRSPSGGPASASVQLHLPRHGRLPAGRGSSRAHRCPGSPAR